MFYFSKSTANLNNIQPNAPPIPPRNQGLSPSYSAGYNSGYAGAYGGYSGLQSFGSNYSTMPSYMGGYNNYPGYSSYGMNNSYNSFLRSAEESSRGAFQSIESVVHAFSAVSAMFESTYYAVYNSFRAVVGVADQFYRLKTHLSGIISALAIVRFLKHIYRKCIRYLLRSGGSIESTDTAWSIAKKLSDTERLVKHGKGNQTNWPLIMFLAVVLGGPWLIWKVLSSMDTLSKDDTLWMTGKIDHFIAVSEYDFDGLNNDELSFRRGQRIIIAPKEYQPKLRGWLLGTIDGKTQGIMPANYLKILGKKAAENSKSSNSDSPQKSNKSPNQNIDMEQIFDQV